MPSQRTFNCFSCSKLDFARRFAWVSYYKLKDSILDEVKNEDFVMTPPMKRILNSYVKTLKNEDACCSICLEKLNGEIVITKCAHLFHLECIDDDVVDKCPLCREKLSYDKL